MISRKMLNVCNMCLPRNVIPPPPLIDTISRLPAHLIHYASSHRFDTWQRSFLHIWLLPVPNSRTSFHSTKRRWEVIDMIWLQLLQRLRFGGCIQFPRTPALCGRRRFPRNGVPPPALNDAISPLSALRLRRLV